MARAFFRVRDQRTQMEVKIYLIAQPQKSHTFPSAIFHLGIKSQYLVNVDKNLKGDTQQEIRIPKDQLGGWLL
jgi:hypothetical protein